ncbi:hypothetical protein CYLTODRAFT_417573 [Cylindrobasidium torrendii FP15055 ss-10]|uniref:N-acetyltransferase domain-containing protein n=1 Tax=Cylindrobasidium torrendii FP15055 ss-10 TaxID=1314674 RepID=A0A0D7BT68_9AGAR|nr:hypothetical protein CYLTODRAFT_417573 [Cylindrobasidium torrendii FP15055 ss-10]
MENPVARIRPLKSSDEPATKFGITKASLAELATANVKSALSPITLAIWVVLCSSFLQYMQWWPGANAPFYKYLSIVPICIAFIAPIIALADWVNRPYFEERTQTILHGPDMTSLYEYYNKSGNGFWLLEYGDTKVGFIAAERKGDTTHVTHLYVDEPFRKAHAQNDLLEYAIKEAFSTDGIVAVTGETSPFSAYIGKAYKTLGFFQASSGTKRVGIYRWKVGQTWRLSREEWESKK